MPPKIQLHTAVEQSLSRLIYRKEAELDTLRQNLLDKIKTEEEASNNQSPSKKTTSITTTNTETPASHQQLLQNQEEQEETERKNQQQNLLRSNLLSATNPCICSPMFWWCHRALKSNVVSSSSSSTTQTIHSNTIETECNQLITLCLHILSHNNNHSANNNNSNSSSTSCEPLVSLLCGNPDLFSALNRKIRSTSPFLANQIALGIIEIKKVDYTASHSSSDNTPKKAFCKIFAFGYFPGKEPNTKLFDFNSQIGEHLVNSSTFSFIIGHCLWPDCEGPFKPTIEKTAAILKQEAVSVTNYKNGAIQKLTVDAKHASAFSSCLLIRCSRHPEQVTTLSSSMPLNEMRTEMRCSRLCRLPLRCGEEKHLCTERCHSLAEHESTACPFPCTKKTPGCEHPCRKLCGETPCDCLRTTARDLECSHLTLKGHRLHHRFEGACCQAHSPCKVSVPVRCSHCFGVSFIPCSEVQDCQQQQQQQSDDNNENNSNELPEMPESFKCKDCQDMEYKVRSQIKLDLAKEVAQKQQDSQREQQKTFADQTRAATRGIFQLGQQVIINNTKAILDSDLASALFPDVEEQKWAKIVDNEEDVIESLQDSSSANASQLKASFVNALGVVTSRQNDPTDPTIILYMLSVPTHGGHVAVNDTGLSLVRGVFTGGEEGNALLMIEAKKNRKPNQSSSSSGKNEEKPLDERFPLGTRVVVVDGILTSTEGLSREMLYALDHSLSNQQHQQEQNSEASLTTTTTGKSKGENNTDSNNNNGAAEEMDEDDADEIFVDQQQQQQKPSSISSIKISNIVGTVSNIVKKSIDDKDAKKGTSDSAANYKQDDDTSEEDDGKVIVTLEINLIINSNNTTTSSFPQRREREDVAANDATDNNNKSNNNTSSSHQEQRLVTLEVECSPSAVVPLFGSGSTVRIREPSRHVTDAKERSFFGILPHHVVGLPQLQEFMTNNNNNSNNSQQQQRRELPFSRKFLADNTRCVVQGFVNAPKATPISLQRDTTLRSAVRRGPCYIVSIFTETRRFTNSSSSFQNDATAPVPRLFLVPLFFADLDIDEIVDKTLVSKIEAELEVRTKEKMEEYLEEKFISNQEVAQKRRKEIEDEQKKNTAASKKKGSNKTDSAPENNIDKNKEDEKDQQQQHQYATVRLQTFSNKQEEAEATQRFMNAKKFALGSYNALLQRDDALGGSSLLIMNRNNNNNINNNSATAMVSVGVVRQLAEVFEKEFHIDQSARNGMIRMISTS